MPLYQADIEKRLGSEFWTNRYIINAPDFASANEIADNLTAAERTIHATSVTLTRYRLSTTAINDGIYTIVPLNVSGLRAPPGSLLPLFNTLRVDLQAAVGRPSRKFYRGVLAESDIAGDAMQADFSAFVNLIEVELATEIRPGVVDPQGTVLLNATVYDFVQMRQLRRSRRRRTNGGGIFQ